MGSIIVTNLLKNPRFYSIFRPFGSIARSMSNFSKPNPKVNSCAIQAINSSFGVSPLSTAFLRKHHWNVLVDKKLFSILQTSFSKSKESKKSKETSFDKQNSVFSNGEVCKIYEEAAMFGLSFPDFANAKNYRLKAAKNIKELTEPFKIRDLKSLWDDIQIQNPGVKKLEFENLAESYEQIHETFRKWIAENKDHITKLSLASSSLHFLPEAIGDLSSLKYLDLSYNFLKVIPDSIGKLTNLEKLDLSHNNIEFLPNSICQLTKLVKLDLSYNHIQFLPDSFFSFPELYSLDLKNNNLIKLPESVGNMPEIRYLDLQHNKLQELPEIFGNSLMIEEYRDIDDPKKILSDRLNGFSKLKKLCLNNNELYGLPDTFENLRELESLTLHNNKLITLPDNFGNLTNLYFELTLYNNHLTDFPDSIRNLKKLKVISAQNNLFCLKDLFRLKISCSFKIVSSEFLQKILNYEKQLKKLFVKKL